MTIASVKRMSEEIKIDEKSEAPKEYEYRCKIPNDGSTHVDCYYHDEIQDIPCEGEMLQFPPHPSHRMGQHKCCQGHAYLTWGNLAGIDQYYNWKRVFAAIGKKVSQ